MVKKVLYFSSEGYGKLKRKLDENSFEPDSFAKLGYILRDSAQFGLEKGYILYFDVPDEVLTSLLDKLKDIEGFKEIEGEEKQKVIAKINEEEESAASGFGNIFS